MGREGGVSVITKLDEMIAEFHDNWCATGSYMGNDTAQKQFHEEKLRKFAAEIEKNILNDNDVCRETWSMEFTAGYEFCWRNIRQNARDLGVVVE